MKKRDPNVPGGWKETGENIEAVPDGWKSAEEGDLNIPVGWQQGCHQDLKLDTKGVREYMWRDCGKVLEQSSKQETHMEIHSGERPFKCELCPTTCDREAELELYVRRINTSKRPMSCKTCGEGLCQGDSSSGRGECGMG